MTDLRAILHERFGFGDFRPHQAEACEVVAEGRDALLVMPTGAGKSLCYQLPGVARGGNVLVVSPLIALMEDQATKLAQQGFKVARIHSGRHRDEANQACIDWRDGNLDFLFIAPERLRNAGFVKWLQKRPAGLIAIDEAHCISHWGHDFRPEYRMLGHRLSELRPAPVIALTATATPRVQQDIVDQLSLKECKRLIHGFRRENLGIEVMDIKPSQRADAVLALLAQGERLPAIVYVPTRKECDSLSGQIAAKVPCLPYHAGLSATERDRAQTAFIAGDVPVIVATIAFGMGIDKADIRTIIHTALPSSLEGYYQEIGRAGRDGKASRAVLMWGWNDRRIHEHFFERDYPPVAEMRELYNALSSSGQSVDALAADLGLRGDDAQRRLGKLAGHGGAWIDADGYATRGDNTWTEPYTLHAAHKREQLDRVVAFAQGNTCRMNALVAHFGERVGAVGCGRCDICAPTACIARSFREPNESELAHLQRITEVLRVSGGMSTGKIYRDYFEEGGLSRRDFEPLLAALEQNGLVETSNEAFEKDGREIQYRKAALTQVGYELITLPADAVMLPGEIKQPAKKKRAAKTAAAHNVDAPADVVAALKAWRLQEAKAAGVPAFRIMGNKTLDAVAAARPNSLDALAEVHGIGPAKLELYGEALLRVLREHGA
jgi:RecQ family ATP-dependent DNA helicase